MTAPCGRHLSDSAEDVLWSYPSFGQTVVIPTYRFWSKWAANQKQNQITGMRNRKLWIAVGLKVRKALLFNIDQNGMTFEILGQRESGVWERGAVSFTSNPGSNMEERSRDVNDTEDTISCSLFFLINVWSKVFAEKNVRTGLLYIILVGCKER